MTEENNVESQGFFDLFKLADKELIDKVLKVAKTVEVEELEDGTTKVSVYLSNR
jgi:hypothetical protein